MASFSIDYHRRAMNPICAAMGWQPPAAPERLMIMLPGVGHVATLIPACAGYAEGVYLTDRDGRMYGPCYSAGPGPRTVAQIRAAIAQKLKIKADTLDTLRGEIVAPAKV